MKPIIVFIKSLFGGIVTKVLIYALLFVIALALGLKACNKTKEWHYAKFTYPHVKIVRDSLDVAYSKLDSTRVRYFNIASEKSQDSLINKDLESQRQQLIARYRNQVKILSSGEDLNIRQITIDKGLFRKPKIDTLIIKR